MTRWRDATLPNLPDPLPDLHVLVGQALLRRGLSSTEAARAFLDPHSYVPAPASALPGMDQAVERISSAIREHEPICVWGDFDVDGQTSTTVLVSALRALGGAVSYHIPVRAHESHGVNIENLAAVIAQGAKLVVTCDTGITANQAVEYATSRGVAMVITDHHDLPAELPAALAIVDPKLLPPEHPLATLAGVGVAYKLAEQLLANRIEKRETSNSFDVSPDSLLDLVALGLVADLALLTGDARYLVQKGLAQLRDTQRLGLKTMMELAELNPAHLTEEHIGFVLGPRLNALGRLGDANPAVELLTTADPTRARVLAVQLEGLNAQRKLLCDQVHQAAEAQLRADPALLTQPVIILAHPSWPGGVIGIVASRLVERYHKPAILFSAPAGEPARGSARSIDGLNITAAIAAQGDLLLNFGGHPMAAGLALAPENLSEFRRRLGRTVDKMFGESQREEAELVIDGWLPLQQANLSLAEQFEALAPFGPGNEKLIVASHNVTLKAASQLGRNKEHLKLTIEEASGDEQTVLWWDGGREELPKGRFDLAYTLRASDWRGTRQAQLEFVDFRVTEEKQVEVISKKIEVVDFRKPDNPLKQLSAVHHPPSSILWSEGEHKKQRGGADRNGLRQSAELIVWTTPPSWEEFKAALDIVRPEKVVIFAIDPGMDDARAFMERLAGLVKFTLNKKAGKTSYAELAAATAQKLAVVRAGVNLLAKRGQVTVKQESGDELILTAGGTLEASAALTLEAQVQSLLKETAAFRAHFRQAEAEWLVRQPETG
jgi:single-stranded-DNA-specific exonuclease